MIETKQHDDIGQRLQDAVLQQAMSADDVHIPTLADAHKEAEIPRGNGGTPVPGGRPKGVRNKLTNLREAVLEAFDQVGGPEYLARLAQGTSSDRAAFVSLVSKVLPTQINANVEGGIQVQLSWLGQRNIGTTTAQPVEQVTQVIDLERDNGGKYRIKDPVDVSPAGGGAAAAEEPAQQNGPGDAQGA